MRVLIAAAAVAVALTGPLAAQDAGPDNAIEGVISGQMQAFRSGDVAAAWAFASPTIKQLFGTQDRFAQMVQRGYPMVWQPGDVQFLELREIGGKQWQKVMVRDGDNVFHILDYEMIETESGWQIDAVQLLPAPQIGA
jgi:hypothetical protein